MRGDLIALLSACVLTGCATPIAKRYYASCVQAGHDPAACEARALEINHQALQGFTASMGSAATSLKLSTIPAQDTLHCISTPAVPGGRVVTTCH